MVNISQTEIEGPAAHVRGFSSVSMCLGLIVCNGDPHLSMDRRVFSTTFCGTVEMDREGGGFCLGLLYQLKIRPNTWEAAP